jgi:hypothetical protein
LSKDTSRYRSTHLSMRDLGYMELLASLLTFPYKRRLLRVAGITERDRRLCRSVGPRRGSHFSFCVP